MFFVSSKKIGYALTGRSEDSRDRTIKPVIGTDNELEFWVKARKELQPEKKAVLEYPWLIKPNEEYDLKSYIIGNGVQTIDLAKELNLLHNDPEDIAELMEEILRKHKVEPDGKTPRIAAVVKTGRDSADGGQYFNMAVFGIIYPGANGKDEVKTFEVELKSGVFQGIATYTAKGPDVDPAHGEIITFEDHSKDTVSRAQALAEWEYNKLAKFSVIRDDGELVDTRVAAAALVLEEKWDSYTIGQKLRHETPVINAFNDAI
jgi:hypothetical protein